MNKEILCWDFSQRKRAVYEHTGQLTDTNEQLHLNRPTISMLMWWFFSVRRLWHFWKRGTAQPRRMEVSNEVGIMALPGDRVWLVPSQHLDSQFTACAGCVYFCSLREGVSSAASRARGTTAAATAAELRGGAGDPANPSPRVSSLRRATTIPRSLIRSETKNTRVLLWCMCFAFDQISLPPDKDVSEFMRMHEFLLHVAWIP